MDYTSLITCLSQNEGVSGTDMEIRYKDSLTRYISTLETQLGISRNTKSLSSTLLQISESLLWLKEKKKKPTRLGNVRSVDVWFRERERGKIGGKWVGGEWAVLWEPAWNGKSTDRKLQANPLQQPQLLLEPFQRLETERALICRNISCPHHLGRSFDCYIESEDLLLWYLPVPSLRSICGQSLASIDVLMRMQAQSGVFYW